MEVQQERVDLDPTRELVNIKVDKALFMARQALHKMIDDEQTIATAAGGIKDEWLVPHGLPQGEVRRQF